MICLYAKDETDFSANGLLVLDKFCTSATITEDLNGQYELDIEFRGDDNTYINAIQNEMVLRAPAPVREALELDALATHKIYTTNGRSRMRNKASSSGKTLRTTKKNTKLIWVSTSSNGLYYWMTTMEGASGWVLVSGLTYFGEEATTATGYQLIPKQDADQLFRIYQISHTLDGIEVKARHIFYDLRANYVKALTITNETGATALTSLLAGCIMAHEFTGYSDVTATATMDAGRKNPVDVLLGEDGFLQYGAQLLRDNFNIYLMAAVGKNRGASIAYRKNMTGMTVDVDTKDVITRIIPIGYSKAGAPIYITGDYVDSTHIADYAQPRIMELDCKDVKVGKDYANTAAVQAKLAALAAEEFAKGIDLPIINADIEYCDMDAQTVGPIQAGLRTVYLGDTVMLRHEDYGFNLPVKVTGYTWDALHREYTALTLSNVNADMRSLRVNKNLIPKNAVSGRMIAPQSVPAAAFAEGAAEGIIPSDLPDNPDTNQLAISGSSILIFDGTDWQETGVTTDQLAQLATRVTATEQLIGFSAENGLIISAGGSVGNYLQLLSAAINLYVSGEKVLYLQGSGAYAGEFSALRRLMIGSGTATNPRFGFRQLENGTITFGRLEP